jgi:hypothetical protein
MIRVFLASGGAHERAIADDAEDIYAIANNHNLERGVVNAFELKAFSHPTKIVPAQ